MFSFLTNLFSPKPAYTPPKQKVSTLTDWTLLDHYLSGKAHQSAPTTSQFTSFPSQAAQRAYSTGLGVSAPAPIVMPTVSSGGGGRAVAAPAYKAPKPPKPKVPTLSLDEMMDIINRRVGLMIDPQVEQLRRSLEEERQSGLQRQTAVRGGYDEAIAALTRLLEEEALGVEKRKTDVTERYGSAMEDLLKEAQAKQRAGASIMRARGIYDSGLSMDLVNRLQRAQLEQEGKLMEQRERQLNELAEYMQMRERHGQETKGELSKEQARALAEIEQYMDLRERHMQEQLQGLEGRRGEWGQSLLREMESQERDRKDRLEQQAFENWLAQQSMEHQIWQSNQAAKLAAARATPTPSQPGFRDILEQMQMQALMSMPQQQQYAYALYGPDYLMRQAGGGQPTTFQELLDQEQMRYYQGMTPEERNLYMRKQFGGNLRGIY